MGMMSGSFGDQLLVLRREEVDDPARAERDLADGLGGTDGERLEEVTRAAHDHKVRLMRWRTRISTRSCSTPAASSCCPTPPCSARCWRTTAATRPSQLHRRAHYSGMAAKSAAGAEEQFWHDYNEAYVRAVGVPEARRGVGRDGARPDPQRVDLAVAHSRERAGAASRCTRTSVPMGVVSNASGQIAEVLARSGVCQAGPGPLTPVRVVVDSHLVGVAKPDPHIFDFALAALRRHRPRRASPTWATR